MSHAGHTPALCVVETGHSKGGNVVLLYTSAFDDVPFVVNVAGR